MLDLDFLTKMWSLNIKHFQEIQTEIKDFPNFENTNLKLFQEKTTENEIIQSLQN